MKVEEKLADFAIISTQDRLHKEPAIHFTKKVIDLIHSAHPQSRQVVITIFTEVVRTCVRSHFSKSRKNKTKVKILIATGVTVGLAEWIIDDNCLVTIHSTFTSLDRDIICFWKSRYRSVKMKLTKFIRHALKAKLW